MQQRFASFLQSLKKHSGFDVYGGAPKGLWLIHSDEPLVHQWLIDACRPYWVAHQQQLKRIELSSAKSWLEVLSELTDLSLFGEDNAVVVTGKHKPDKTAQERLAQFAKEVREGQFNHQLIWCLPKQDKQSLNTKAIKLFEQEGVLIDGHIANERARTEILQIKSAELGVMLTSDAWQILLSHTEHNLLTAYQTLWRISYLYEPATQIDASQLMEALVDGASFTVFHLMDAVLAGDAQKSLEIIQSLRQADVAPSIVLWALAKDARFILQIQAGKPPAALGIWQNKIQLYEAAAWRTQHNNHHWLSHIYTIDKAIKGVADTDVWRALAQLALALCGVITLNQSSLI